MSVTAKDVAEIMKLLEASAFDELSLETGDLKIRLRKSGAPAREPVPQPAPPSLPPASANVMRETSAPVAGPAPITVGTSDPSLTDVPSPLLGIFYRAPKPGAAPFVEIGQQVEEDTIIGIVEVMKLMNTVRAGVRGELVEIVAKNAEMVEYGEPLIRVRAA
jgi:acetyl-CoA carboxylase biotin carboxyl carrier protein